MEELTNSAYLICYLTIAWFFTSRENNILLSSGMLIMISISACLISYILALPFYIFVERPFNNFLDLILFPRRAIFVK
jgi:peptidoglycan/LPS O-acetylase OafA/YrhL